MERRVENIIYIIRYHKNKRWEYLIEVSDNDLATENRKVRKSMLDLYVRTKLFHGQRLRMLPEW